MINVNIDKSDSGQTAIKYLKRYMPLIPNGLLYKQLRNKNIVLNSKKMDGSEKLKPGDVLSIYMSDETISKFKGDGSFDVSEYENAYLKFKEPEVIYEDEHVLIINKPVGILSQKSEPGDVSVNEWLIGYLLSKGTLSPSSLNSFKPSICNRLDRNTGGLLLFGKTLFGTNTLNSLLKSRDLKKFYITVVCGRIKEFEHITGYLEKDEKTNKVSIKSIETPGSSFIETEYKLLKYDSDKDISLVEVDLLTGKAHQIRAHLASIGHPVIGDGKYGNAKLNQQFKSEYGLKHQFLYAYKVIFPKLNEYETLSERTISIDIKRYYNKFFKE